MLFGGSGRLGFCLLVILLTVGKPADGIAGVAGRRKVSAGCTSQVEPSLEQLHCISGGYDDSIGVSPGVTRLRITIRHARQHITLRIRFTGWTHSHCSRTI